MHSSTNKVSSVHCCRGPKLLAYSLWADLEVLQGVSPLQRLEGILVIDPAGHGPQHEAQPTREAASVVLPQVKLNAVQSSLHSAAAETILLDLLQLTEDQLLNL